MKTLALASLAAVLAIASMAPLEPANPESIFIGTSPCADFVKPFLRIPSDVKCDRINWQLRLRYDSSTFELTREYGFHVDNRTYRSHGSESVKGTLRTTEGRANDPEATVYQLSGDESHSISFAVIDENLLHLLDRNQRLAIGDSGASYTINKLRAPAPARASKRQHFSYEARTVAENGAIAKTSFSGRSPCQEIARELKRPVAADCFKLKWDLELRRDPQTLVPTTYKLRGTLYRNDVAEIERPREGKWKVIRGMKTDPNAIVYQLDAFGSDGPIYLLRADDGILFFLNNNGRVLVGDKDFSYTLNRFE